MTFEVPWLKPSFPHWFLYPKFEGCRREESSPGVQEHCVASICPVWKRSTYCLCVCIDLSAHWSEPGRARQLLWNHVVSEMKQEAHTFSDSRTLLEARSPAVPWRLQKSALEICNHFVEFVVVWHQKPQVSCSVVTAVSGLLVSSALRICSWILHWKPQFFTTFLMVFKYSEIHYQEFTLPLVLIECSHWCWLCAVRFHILIFLFVFKRGDGDQST